MASGGKIQVKCVCKFDVLMYCRPNLIDTHSMITPSQGSEGFANVAMSPPVMSSVTSARAWFFLFIPLLICSPA